MAVAANVFPIPKQYMGIARELTAGTLVNPLVTMPITAGEPDEKPTFIVDPAFRGDMSLEHALIQATEIGDLSFNGPVYLDTIGYFLDNLLGDMSSTGSTPTNSTTFTGALAAGATTGTLTSPTGYTASSVVQIGSGSTAEVVQFTALAGSNATWANNPLRFAHSGTPAASTVVAPFTHVFSLLNSSYSGTGSGQPPTHTLTYYQGVTATSGARQYASWAGNSIDFTMDSEQLFTHDTKGTCWLGQIFPTAPPVETLTGVTALPAWRFAVGLGGTVLGSPITTPASFGITLERTIKPFWTLQTSQNPFVIARGDLKVSGKATFVATDESPMLNMLNNVQPQLQMIMTNGLAGASLLSIQFDIQVAAYDTSKIMATDVVTYDVTFKAISNSTNAGGSGGTSPMKVTLINAVPTY